MSNHRKREISPQLQQIQYQESMQRLRNTMKIKQIQRQPDLYKLRNSYSTTTIRYFEPQQSAFGSSTPKANQAKSLKSALDQLQSKIKSAKKQLQDKPPQNIFMPKTKRLLTLETQSLQESVIQKKPTESILTQKKVEICGPLITTAPRPKNSKTFNINPYSPRRHNIYYISQLVRAINQKNSLAMQHVNSSIKILKACENEYIPQNAQIENKKLNLKKKQYYKGKKTLILDLDQTLVHCNQNSENQCDLKLSIKVDPQNQIEIGINIRPYAISFLKKMAAKFEIIIFTASHQSYADVVLDQLDPEKQIFQHRLYRQHCHVLDNQLHVKDLRIINRPINEIVLVDNAAYSYAFQLENGIPILPFYEGNDYELPALENYLQKIERAHDVRQVNKKTFKLHHYAKFATGEQLVEQIYMNNFFF